jgi:hypothetical protein
MTIKTEVRDHAPVSAACRRLELAPPLVGTAQLFGDQATGLIISLPGWTYPIVVDTNTGQVRDDNYGGAWGDQAQLDRLLQMYAVEKARIEARRGGHQVSECRETSKFVEQALGQRTGEQLTAEYYQSQSAGQQLEQSS